ncbi:MAG: carbohydrate kinase [Actinobacteria bacterium]|nr:carbohydrate kinase [Actinomycetota bacterium]
MSLCSKEKFIIVGIGEILWDLFPEERRFGGAPANFAYHVSALGHQGIIASRIGKDALGKEIFNYLTSCGISTKYIQIDPNHPTGTVNVKTDEEGHPEYIIKQNVAWDFFEFDEKWKNLARKADAINFSSLSQRSLKSYYTIKEFLNYTRKDTVRIFDINLRQNFYSTEIITQSLNASSILKINNEELSILIDLLDYQGKKSQEESCKFLVKKYELDLLCLTNGKNGSLLVTNREMVRHRGYKVNIVDTVGAGDAFLAALVVKYLEGKSLKEMSEAANKIGSWVASQFGATPLINEYILKELL